LSKWKLRCASRLMEDRRLEYGEAGSDSFLTCVFIWYLHILLFVFFTA
jgi:hypothetical protein